MQDNTCGATLSLHVDLEGQQLPQVGDNVSAVLCGSYNVLGAIDCCVQRQRVDIKRCSDDVIIYNLRPQSVCPAAVCATRRLLWCVYTLVHVWVALLCLYVGTCLSCSVVFIRWYRFELLCCVYTLVQVWIALLCLYVGTGLSCSVTCWYRFELLSDTLVQIWVAQWHVGTDLSCSVARWYRFKLLSDTYVGTDLSCSATRWYRFELLSGTLVQI